MIKDTSSLEMGESLAESSDSIAEQFAEIRYAKVLDELVAEAADGKQMHILADSLAWTFAHIAVRCGVGATGDMLRRVGGYIGKIEYQRESQEQAQQPRQEGRLPS